MSGDPSTFSLTSVATSSPPHTTPGLSTLTSNNIPELRRSHSGRPPSYTSTNVPVNPPFVAADYVGDKKKHLLLCASGSVATIKLPSICRALASYDRYLSIRIILTEAAEHFLAGQSAEQPMADSLLSIPNVEAIYRDADEWLHPWRRNAPILHIELRRWSDICVVAPLSANTLAKMVTGMADDLLTEVLRAWDTDGSIENRGKLVEGGLRKRVVVAPAMNDAMWLHPVTEKQMKVLTEEWGVGAKGRKGTGWVEVLMPTRKELACGDVGRGAMAPWEDIVSLIKGRLWLDTQQPPTPTRLGH